VARERTTFYDDIATNTSPLYHPQYCSLHLRRVGAHLPRRLCSLPPSAGDVCLWRCVERGVVGRLCSSFNKGWPSTGVRSGFTVGSGSWDGDKWQTGRGAALSEDARLKWNVKCSVISYAWRAAFARATAAEAASRAVWTTTNSNARQLA